MEHRRKEKHPVPQNGSMRELLGPIAAVALIAQLNPDLPAQPDQGGRP